MDQHTNDFENKTTLSAIAFIVIFMAIVIVIVIVILTVNHIRPLGLRPHGLLTQSPFGLEE